GASPPRMKAWDRGVLLARCGDANKRLRLPADNRRVPQRSKFASQKGVRMRRVHMHSLRIQRHPAKGEPWDRDQVNGSPSTMLQSRMERAALWWCPAKCKR